MIDFIYTCSVCKSCSTPLELNIDFHVGKVRAKTKLKLIKWDMLCPSEILSLGIENIIP